MMDQRRVGFQQRPPFEHVQPEAKVFGDGQHLVNDCVEQSVEEHRGVLAGAQERSGCAEPLVDGRQQTVAASGEDGDDRACEC
jgi:hypothetical protein